MDGDTAAAALKADTSDVYDTSNADSGCNGFGHSVASPFAMPIIGTWKDDWDTDIVITSTTWNGINIEVYTDSLLVYQNPADASWNPSKWVKIEFHTIGDGFGYCQSVMDGDTAAAALKADTSAIYDSSNADSGCNGFGHSVASPVPAE